jgi:hypothetical protein
MWSRPRRPPTPRPTRTLNPPPRPRPRAAACSGSPTSASARWGGAGRAPHPCAAAPAPPRAAPRRPAPPRAAPRRPAPPRAAPRRPAPPRAAPRRPAALPGIAWAAASPRAPPHPPAPPPPRPNPQALNPRIKAVLYTWNPGHRTAEGEAAELAVQVSPGLGRGTTRPLREGGDRPLYPCWLPRQRAAPRLTLPTYLTPEHPSSHPPPEAAAALPRPAAADAGRVRAHHRRAQPAVRPHPRLARGGRGWGVGDARGGWEERQQEGGLGAALASKRVRGPSQASPQPPRRQACGAEVVVTFEGVNELVGPGAGGGRNLPWQEDGVAAQPAAWSAALQRTT